MPPTTGRAELSGSALRMACISATYSIMTRHDKCQDTGAAGCLVAGAWNIMKKSNEPAASFSFSFDWGDIPLCTSGYPNVVENPTFELNSVPAGTASIVFRLTDEQVPSYPHGGGTVAYAGQSTILPGAFRYKSPCPPSGSHTYTWTAEAFSQDGKILAIAKSSQRYP